ncbi:MAG: GWxTD domain-containing protein [Bacteroidales bacterium]|jgi:GWxTD domain-containing protein|nr:GWxTD domain-containing protein [Bacteroidales bacterium]
MNRKSILFILLISLSVFSAFGQKSITAHFSYAAFSANNEPYIETYLSIPQEQLTHVKDSNGVFTSEVQITMVFKHKDNIVEFNKYALLGQPIKDTTNIDINLIDLQRFYLDNGEYTFELTLKDKNDTTNILKGNTKVIVEIPADQVASSTITFIDSYKKTSERTILTKSGYDLTPYFSILFPENKNELTFYSEIYNLQTLLELGSRIVIYTYIESKEIPGEFISGYSKMIKSSVAPVVPVFNSINIEYLPSGNYYLTIQVKDMNGYDIISTKKFFQRSNPKVGYNEDLLTNISINNTFVSGFTSVDTLREIIKSFVPKASDYERNFIKKVDTITNINTLQQFVYHFWSERDELDPSMAFVNYMTEVKKVNNSYGNAMRKGYDTDRGRVYLQYGPPNHIHENRMSSATKPYEIWQYYKIEGQSNKRFVFATLDAALKDYDLIHSDVIGELYNPKWQHELYLNAPITDDSESMEEMWGAPLDEYYKDPR